MEDKPGAASPRRKRPFTDTIAWVRDVMRTQIFYARVLGDDLPEFRETVTNENLRWARVGAVGLFLINIVGLLVQSIQFTDPANPQPFSRRLVLLYAMNVAVCLLFIPAISFALARSPRRSFLRQALVWLFVAWVFWVGVVFTVNGQNQLDHLINYLFVLVFAAVVFPLPAIPSFAMYCASVVALYFWMGAVQEDALVLWGLRGNSFSAALMAFVVSRAIFSMRLFAFTRTKLIERQAHELAHERRERRLDGFCLAHELTQREREILGLLIEGLPNHEIADRVFVSTDTVKKHVYHIFQKAGVANRFELARVIENGAPGG
jgi:DNA-binding CsgD family transcriptional regulator